MNRLRNFSLIALIGLCAATARAEDKKPDDKAAVKKDLELLQGEWSMLMPDGSGTTIPDSKRVCQGDETTVTFGGRLMMKARFAIDPSKTPKTIDYEILDGDGKGKKRLGIYEVDGETAKFCFGTPEGERPTDFTSKQSDGRFMSIWKRVKK